ncbi:MAG: carbamoyl-phosphate synthase small subunit [Legionellaceae bacterium]|nr:carbamoyl-phosphate synthase small subunit [Legionellaceae bacterium]HCA88786.1 carbamoyl-phosphate synthase small subunit [Legionellales bacterium]|tara:strand:- start:11851 stop:12999 length:1149 start_codon:yes stop_codon:yes gene_type:complete
MIEKPAILALADGTIFTGYAVGADGEALGELVFNTAMTGYQEILTDPSYCGQIITLTAAHVGNTGINDEDNESSRVWAKGLVVREFNSYTCHYRSNNTLEDFLKRHHIVAIAGVDTRALTLILQQKGAMNACITTDITQSHDVLINKARQTSSLANQDLAVEVTRQTIERWHESRGSWASHTAPLTLHVVAYDFGVKHSILKILNERGCHITLVPAKTSAEEVQALNPDGILLSNGPGDPKACTYAIKAIHHFLDNDIPLFGICLGFQLLGLALGAKSRKMKFGHHGANHPVVAVDTLKRVFITSQNHGFAIEEASLPDELVVTHRSLFDQSLQGFRHSKKPALGFQGHPEASPGPHDIATIFDEFIKMMHKRIAVKKENYE